MTAPELERLDALLDEVERLRERAAALEKRCHELRGIGLLYASAALGLSGHLSATLPGPTDIEENGIGDDAAVALVAAFTARFATAMLGEELGEGGDDPEGTLRKAHRMLFSGGPPYGGALTAKAMRDTVQVVALTAANNDETARRVIEGLHHADA
jgi:hypothetical protein